MEAAFLEEKSRKRKCVAVFLVLQHFDLFGMAVTFYLTSFSVFKAQRFFFSALSIIFYTQNELSKRNFLMSFLFLQVILANFTARIEKIENKWGWFNNKSRRNGSKLFEVIDQN